MVHRVCGAALYFTVKTKSQTDKTITIQITIHFCASQLIEMLAANKLPTLYCYFVTVRRRRWFDHPKMILGILAAVQLQHNVKNKIMRTRTRH